MSRASGQIVGTTGPRRLAAAWGTVCALAILPAAARAQDAAKLFGKHPTPGPRPLVEADDELAGHLARARRLAEAGEHADAITILQALIERPEGGFVAAGGGRYVALADAANELVGRLGRKGLALYRRRYGARARRMYEEAVRSGRTDMLHEVAALYPHTRFGARAIDELGAACFDRARFAAAALLWQRRLAIEPPGVARAMFLAKTAAAWRLAGESARARQLADALKSKYPQAVGPISGRRQGLSAFVEALLDQPSRAPGRPGTRQQGWPGAGGGADGLAVMADCNVVLSARWTHPPAPLSDAAKQVIELVAGRRLGELRAARSKPGAPRLRKGRVVVRYGTSRASRYTPLSAAVHPVVVGGTVVYRTDAGVVACDVLTGEKLWDTGWGLPLEIAPETKSDDDDGPIVVLRGLRPTLALPAGESGRYVLTAADGKVFAEYAFTRLGRSHAGPAPSGLAAISVGTGRSGGKLLWRIGQGRGDSLLVRSCRFVSPPTWHNGRLYVLAYHAHRFHMLCLNASTGSLIWRRMICEPPEAFADTERPYSAAQACRSSPPAVGGGRIFALPNVGVLVALEAATGRALWAYHYDSFVNRPRPGADVPYHDTVNPILVLAGSVICLPGDSNFLVARAASDGRAAWSEPVRRDGYASLSAVDAERLLLSGPGLRLLRAADGKPSGPPLKATGVAGRPAVTTRRVYASGQGVIYQIDLTCEEPRLTSTELADPRGILGNLVSTGEALVAANRAGICAYFSYDVARKRIEQRMGAAQPKQRARLGLKLAQLAFYARKYSQTMRFLTDTRKYAQIANDTVLIAETRGWTYRTRIGLGNCAKDPEHMLEMFHQALSEAATPRDRALMKLRLAKAFEKTGALTAAVALAQEISHKHADQVLIDVSIGPDAPQPGCIDPDAPELTGRQLGQALVRQLIARHGRHVYAGFDREAAVALEAARLTKDPEQIKAVAERWPLSASAANAWYAAAEAYYVKALAEQGCKLDEFFREAVDCLNRLTGTPLEVHGKVALAAMYARAEVAHLAMFSVRQVGDVPAGTPFRFADIHGDLRATITALRSGKLPSE